MASPEFSAQTYHRRVSTFEAEFFTMSLTHSCLSMAYLLSLAMASCCLRELMEPKSPLGEANFAPRSMSMAFAPFSSALA